MGASNGLLFILYPLKIEESDFDQNGIDIIFILGVIIFITAFAITIGPIAWLYLAEIMTEIGMGIAVSANWFIIILISYLPSITPVINQEDIVLSNQTSTYGERNLSWFFFFFSGFGMGGYFLVSLQIKETKGKTPKKIMNLYSNKLYNPLIESDSDEDNNKSKDKYY